MSRIVLSPGAIALFPLLPISAWWFAAMSGTAGAGSVAASRQAIELVLLLQLVGVCLFAPHWSLAIVSKPEDSWSFADIARTLGLAIAPAFPLLAMLSLASTTALVTIGYFQIIVLATGVSIMLSTLQMQRRLSVFDGKYSVNATVGIVAGIAAYAASDTLLRWAGL